MTGTPGLHRNRASAAQTAAHLRACDESFVPPLNARVNIDDYARKLGDHAQRFEAWADGELIGLVAAYCNAPDRQRAFITSVSVLPSWQGRGVASQLLAQCLEYLRHLGFARVELETDDHNSAAHRLYARHGFSPADADGRPGILYRILEEKATMENQRDYDTEIRDTADHKYAYSFDFDVMHPYMIRSFEPFFRPGSLLELGSFKGDFTRRLLHHFDDVTCVEASDVALKEARQRLGDKVDLVHAPFETVQLPRRYDNVVLTHVLEHLDEPVQVLGRIKNEWLAPNGRLFLVCPNANAPSRQIAVKMGLISHNAAVTPAEHEHGHRRTYSLDTLERDAVAAGLIVRHRSGIFFKALANFQWDRLLQTDIVSKEYLDGCYKLGQQYPDLCSSIFLLCE
jgi:GNAT superfamily N-acetyltransferase/SAM-dependent methyltransferase